MNNFAVYQTQQRTTETTIIEGPLKLRSYSSISSRKGSQMALPSMQRVVVENQEFHEKEQHRSMNGRQTMIIVRYSGLGIKPDPIHSCMTYTGRAIIVKALAKILRIVIKSWDIVICQMRRMAWPILAHPAK